MAGDTHGNTAWVVGELYPRARNLGADLILIVGDFGYWEHEQAGIDFLDDLDDTAQQYEIPTYFLRGNHDKLSLLLEKYGDKRASGGFIAVRPNVLFIPDGHIWYWDDVSCRAFGGAYSVDKNYRLKKERKRLIKAKYREAARVKEGLPARPVPPTAGTLWFPEEELTDAEYDGLLGADSGPIDIIFSHDVPHGVNTGLPPHNDLGVARNRNWLRRLMHIHQPRLWLHGHLHHRYTDTVRCGDNDAWTKVIGLAPDYLAARQFWQPCDSYCLLDITSEEVEYTSGPAAEDQITRDPHSGEIL